MGISIVNQINEQECGVCALTSLHNHYYRHQNIDKEKVLDQCRITCNGMSIFDFEVTANKLGLECESYEIKWSEFVSLKINSYFVLLVSTNDGVTNHFVIAKKHRRHIDIYDSCSRQMNKISYSDLKNRFLNVVILVTKKPNKTFSNVFGKAKTLLSFDLKFVILNIILSLLILATSIGTASFLNWIIDLAIGKSSIRNLLSLSFMFIVIYFSNDLLQYITNLYSSGHLKSYFLLFTNKILSSLQNKKFSFLNKVDKNWIYKVDECVFNISNFCIVEVNKLITNIIFATICIFIIGFVQYYLLIFALIIPLIQLIFFVFSYRKKKDVFINVVRAENKNANNYKQLINSLSNELWEKKRTHLIDQIKLNYSSIYKNFQDVALFKGNTNLFKSFLKSLVEIALIATLGYLIIRNYDLTIGSLTFVLAAIGLYRNSTSDIFNYFLAKLEFDVYWQVYKDLTEVDNLNNEKILDFQDEIKTIKFRVEGRDIELTSAKDNITKYSVIELLTETSSICINQTKVDRSNSNILNNFIVCDEKSNLDINFFTKMFEQHPEEFVTFIKYFQINLNSQDQPFLKTIVLNLLCLFIENKKIIFLDSILDLFPLKDKLVVKDIVNKIQRNNSVFVIRKEEYD